MGKGYRFSVLALLMVGLVVSIVSATDLCNFGCTETHLYRLFGLPFPAVGIAFFLLGGILVLGTVKFPVLDVFFSALVAGAAGAEINMILLQKNVIGAWCPLCLGIAAVVFLLTAGQLGRYLLPPKEGVHMNLKSVYKPLMMCAVALLGFTLTFSGIAKKEAVASQLNFNLGKQDSKLEIYLFSDWLCPICATVEGVIEAQYPTLSQKAKILFVDKIIHPEAVNFVPYNLSFLAYEKPKYMALRKALFAVGKKTRNPTYNDVVAAIAPLGVTYKQLSFMDVTQEMAAFRQLSEQFKVTATPTLVIRNAKTNKSRTLIGHTEITPERIAKAVKELE